LSDELVKPEKKQGRPKGSRTALTTKVVDDIFRHWKKNGSKALDVMAEEDPASYVRTIASLIPRDVKLQTEINVSFIDAIKQIEERARLAETIDIVEVESSQIRPRSIPGRTGKVAEGCTELDS
jgi:hypothetical protein